MIKLIKKFNPNKANLEAIKPSKYDKELNKCYHPDIDEDGVCKICGAVLNTDMSGAEFEITTATLVSYLESMKMQINKSCKDKRIKRMANKYFAMIPYLNNMSDLYEICKSYSGYKDIEDGMLSCDEDLEDNDEDYNPYILSDSDIQMIKNRDGYFDTDTKDRLRYMCNHKDNNGNDLVDKVNDESEDVYCPQCGERWNPVIVGGKEITKSVDCIIGQIQAVKWIGNLSNEDIMECSSAIAFLKKFPQVYDKITEEFTKKHDTQGENNEI